MFEVVMSEAALAADFTACNFTCFGEALASDLFSNSWTPVVPVDTPELDADHMTQLDNVPH